MPLDLAQTLSEQQLPELPPRFVQPLHRREPCHGYSSIPVIDLQELLHQDGHSARMAAQALANACEEWGFFQISTSLMEDVRRLVKEFLNLFMEKKMKRPMKSDSHCSTGYGRNFDFSEDTILDWVDALINYISPPALKNPEYWPDKPAAYRYIFVTRKSFKLYRLSTFFKLSNFLAFLDSSFLEEAVGGEDSQVVLRVNHYPRCQQPDLVLGLRPHSDGSAITLLLHDEVEGLQVKKDGVWWAVKPIPDALIVNIGDMMQVICKNLKLVNLFWVIEGLVVELGSNDDNISMLQLVSNGRYTSMEHRAVVRSDNERISIVVFYLPAASAFLSPITTEGTESQNALYKPIKYGDYLTELRNKELQGKDRINSLLI
ncbi:hypothetical protein L7F22_005588 [Adiantum nelumboides]|nr:hypothetical protein [Adiantum nelumboides]